MDIFRTKYGSKVKYLNKNGYDSDRSFANKYLKEGEEYTVRLIEIGMWSSEVYLEEVSGVGGFNTVMFENVDPLVEKGDYTSMYVKFEGLRNNG